MSVLKQFLRRVFRLDGVRGIERTFAKADGLVAQLRADANTVAGQIVVNNQTVDNAYQAFVTVRDEKVEENKGLDYARTRALRFADKLSELAQ